MMKSLRMMMDSEYSEKQLQLRAECLGILLKNYGNINIHEATYSTQDIYECADDWVSQGHRIPSGIVAYFKAYYMKDEDQKGHQVYH